MTSIFVIKAKTSDRQFKWNYLKNQKAIINFQLHFFNLHQIFNTKDQVDSKYSSYKSKKVSGRQFKCNYLKKRKILCHFFIAFLKFTSNFQYFEKKDQAHSLSVSNIIDSKRS